MASTDNRGKLGHTRFSIAGHDRGGRVAHRLFLDHPEKVKRMMVLDIAPTLGAFEGMNHKSVRRLLLILLRPSLFSLPFRLLLYLVRLTQSPFPLSDRSFVSVKRTHLQPYPLQEPS